MSRARKPGAKWNDRYKHPSVQAGALGDARRGAGGGGAGPGEGREERIFSH